VQIEEIARDRRPYLAPIIRRSFHGIYRWHALRTLESVESVRAAREGSAAIGLSMFTMLGPGRGYLYYVAVDPSRRAGGIGAALLDDALQRMRGNGAREVFACIRSDNVPSLHLFHSRGFSHARLRDQAREQGWANAVRLWRRMVVAPGERVFRRAM